MTINGDKACYSMFYYCENLKVAECDGADTNKFMTIKSIDGTDAIDDMFEGCAQSVTPKVGKSYKYVIEP